MSIENRASNSDVENIIALVNIHEVCLSAARLNIFLYHTKFEINSGVLISKTWLKGLLIRIVEYNDGMMDKIPEFRKIFDDISPKSDNDVFKQQELDDLMNDLMVYSHQVYRNLNIPIEQFRNGLKEIVNTIR